MWGCPPNAHFDDPIRAVRAATELYAALNDVVRAMPPKRAEPISMGVTTGWAFAGNIGSASRAEYAIMGDVVNMAARIMAHVYKNGGGVACDAATRVFLLGRQKEGGTGGAIDLSSERGISVKGKSLPIRQDLDSRVILF